MRVGQARKRDANEREIVSGLTRYGYVVTKVSGKGAPDILVHKAFNRARVWAFEVKSETGTRTKAQQVSLWPVIRCLDDALAALGETWI